jgi:DNA-binding NarL/FixJ family response regulator
VVTIVDDDDTVFAALAAGTRGCVLKGASADEITAAVGPSPRAALCSARA